MRVKKNKQKQIIGPSSLKQEMFLNSDSDITLCGGAAGSGKALRHGEKVHTPDGWINVENCFVGMQVTTPSGNIEKVLKIYPQGEVDIYRVTFQDGSFVDTCENHLWQYHEARGYGVSKVNTTKYLKERLEKGFRPIIPLTEPVEFNTNPFVFVKPYTLGVLLGDGSISTKSVSFITLDDEIKQRIEYEGYTVNQWQKNDTRTKAKTYGISGIQEALRQLKLLGTVSNNKFIPDVCHEMSVNDKFNLVQGLMDTDGYVDNNGSTEFCTVSKELALGFKLLLHSLGFTVTITEKDTFFTYKGKKKQGQKAYILYIRGKYQNKLFSIERKKSRTKEKFVGNRIVNITKLEEKDEATCIAISGNEKLFLTTNYIVTHNTYTSLLIALKFMQYPRATGVIFRRTSKMLTAPGSIWHEALNLFTTVYGDKLGIRTRETELYFPNGSVLKFSHMQHETNMYDHKGGQYSLVIFDEATDFSEDMIIYLLSRMRNANVGHKPQMFLMTNPDYDSFLRLWLQDFYLDDRGIPIEEKNGVKRYFYRQSNTVLWYNSLEEAQTVHGTGDESGILSFTFIGATCRDNPLLLKAQPGYISNLMGLSRVEQERLLHGSWFARPENAGLFKREWCAVVKYPNGRAKKRVRAWDFAFTKPSEQYPNPDWTAGVLISKDEAKVYTVEDAIRIRDRVHEVEKLVFETAIRDGRGVTITIPLDPAAAAGAYAKDLQRKLADMGFSCRLVKPVKSKITRFAPFSSLAQAGFVQVVEGAWNKDFYDELERFDGDKHKKDDQVDCCSDAMLVLNRELDIPIFNVPDFIRENSFGYQPIVREPMNDDQLALTLPE